MNKRIVFTDTVSDSSVVKNALFMLDNEFWKNNGHYITDYIVVSWTYYYKEFWLNNYNTLYSATVFTITDEGNFVNVVKGKEYDSSTTFYIHEKDSEG